MNSANVLRSEIEARFPGIGGIRSFRDGEYLSTGIAAIDKATGGVPLNALTEICGSSVVSSGKTSLLLSLLSQATQQGRFCALIDAKDSFDPASAEAAGVNLSLLRWTRCGKTRQRLKPLEQAFKATDGLLQNGGFGLIAVDISDIPEKYVRNVPISTWFRFSKVVENLPTALVFIEQHPHATSCAGLVLKLLAEPATHTGKLLTRFNLKAEVIRTREKKGVQSVTQGFSINTQWA
jgi:recombination protein RecA